MLVREIPAHYSLHVTAIVQEQFYRNRTDADNDTTEMANAEQELCYIVQSKSFVFEKCILLRSSLLSRTSKLANSPAHHWIEWSEKKSFWAHKQLNDAMIEVQHPVVVNGRHPLMRLIL